MKVFRAFIFFAFLMVASSAPSQAQIVWNHVCDVQGLSNTSPLDCNPVPYPAACPSPSNNGIWVVGVDSVSASVTITDDGGTHQSWQTAVTRTANQHVMSIFWTYLTGTCPTAIRITWTGTAIATAVTADVVDFVDQVNPLDVTASVQYTSNAATQTSGNFTTGRAGEYVFSIIECGADAFTAGSGYTMHVGTQHYAFDEENSTALTGAPGTYSATWGSAQTCAFPSPGIILAAAFRPPATASRRRGSHMIIKGLPSRFPKWPLVFAAVVWRRREEEIDAWMLDRRPETD
jgi:hypothetical protein